MIELSIKDRRGNIIKHQLGEGKHTLGKSIVTDVILMDHYVSRHHADIIVTKDAVFLVDSGSKNGAWVNGRRIEKCCRLRETDLVRLGGLELCIKSSSFHFAIKSGAGFSADEISVPTEKTSNVVALKTKNSATN